MRGRYWVAGILILFGCMLGSIRADAASGVVQFTTTTPVVTKGGVCTVVCQVTSEEAFLDTAFSVSYDDHILTFLTGGAKVKGGNGLLKVSSLGNTEETKKKTFSLQFEAKKKGSCLIELEGQADIIDSEGGHLSLSSNRLTVTVQKKGAVASPSPAPSANPKVTPQPLPAKENRLKKLSAHCVSFEPNFAPEQKEYNVTVDAATDKLYISYAPMDEKARVLLKGNEELVSGSNRVIVRVLAENGGERQYVLNVRKETKKETKKREEQGQSQKKDMTFSIARRGDGIFIQNAYEFEVLDASEVSQVPAGYIQSNIELKGITIPAFTMEQDLDNNYLLLYLKGPSKQSTWYQYDREEQTLQRYTGTMTERVNRGDKGEREGTADNSNYIWIVIVVVLVIMLLCMLIAMLKMAMQRKRRT